MIVIGPVTDTDELPITPFDAQMLALIGIGTSNGTTGCLNLEFEPPLPDSFFLAPSARRPMQEFHSAPALYFSIGAKMTIRTSREFKYLP